VCGVCVCVYVVYVYAISVLCVEGVGYVCVYVVYVYAISVWCVCVMCVCLHVSMSALPSFVSVCRMYLVPMVCVCVMNVASRPSMQGCVGMIVWMYDVCTVRCSVCASVSACVRVGKLRLKSFFDE